MRARFAGLCLLAASLRAAPVLAQASARLPGIPGYDLHELDTLAARKRTALRPALARAVARDTASLRAIIALADPEDSAALSSSIGYPSMLWSLLLVWGDRGFAAPLADLAPPARQLVISALDKGAGAVFAAPFPATWALGTHDSTLLGVRAGTADTTIDTLQVYGPAGLHRMPGVVPGSCLPLGYPKELLDEGVSGRAVIEIVLDSAGTEMEPRAHAVAATHADFAASAERFVRSCIYAPGRRAGRAVRSTMRLAVGFVPDSIEVRSGPTTFHKVRSASVHRLAESLGIPYAQTLLHASRGDTAALHRVLTLAEFLPPRSPAALDYTQALEAMRIRFGDRGFAAALASLTPAARERIGILFDFQEEDLHDFPVSSAAVPHPPVTPAVRTPDPAEPVIEGAVEEALRLRVGTCRLPGLPGDLRRIRLHMQVILEFVIDTAGRVDDRTFRVLVSPGIGFNRPAQDAAMSCRYRPGRVAGLPVRTLVRRPVNFDYTPRSPLRIR